jgi:hypothetical protein
MHTKGLKHATSGTFFKKNPICFFFSQTAPTGLFTEAEEGVVCEEKIDRVSFEKMSLTWHVLDLWCASAIVQIPR